MKTPDKIKKGLCICKAVCNGKNVKTCDMECTYFYEGTFCKNALHHDTLAYIRQFEAGLEMWESVAASPGAVEDLAIENNRLMARVAELEKQLADVNASPFDGGMSQQEYFGG